VFSQNAAQLYAELTEAEAVAMLRQLLCIDIDKASLSQVSQAVALEYAPSNQSAVSDAVSTVQEIIADDCALAEREPSAVLGPDGESCVGKGFLDQRLEELDARADRDSVIQNAIDGKLEGVESKEVAKTVAYSLADGTGIPDLKKELSANGKSGGGAKTFEAKIGAVFQQGFSDGGLPLLSGGGIARLPGTTKYTGTVGKIDQFDPQFAQFTESHGIYNADQIVFLGDGASWIWNMQKRLFPNAICIIDFYHATEHLNEIVDLLPLFGPGIREKFRQECHRLLKLGDIDKLASLIREKARLSKNKAEEIAKRLAYFTENAAKMRYGLFRAAGLFIGSGVIEAACKTIVGKRMKNAGMHWSKKNAEGVIALRCAINSGEFGAQAA
jgi:hypothetical protein